MGKTKTSKKPGFSLKSMEKIKLNKDVKVIKDNSLKNMSDTKKIKRALADCIFSDDMETFKEILRAHLDTVNISQFAEETGMARKTIYRILEPESNPTFKNITKLLSAISA